MEQIILALPELSHQAAVEQYISEYPAEQESISGSNWLLKFRGDYPGWVSRCRDFRMRNFRDGSMAPGTLFLGIRPSDGKIIGTIDIRHELNGHLRQFGGHIGYGVSPAERKKGYASQMLALALDFCRETLGITEALVTCNGDNEPSRRTILKAGGVYEGTSTEPDGNPVERYWVPTNEKIYLVLPLPEHAPFAETYLAAHEAAGESVDGMQGAGGLMSWRDNYPGWVARCAAFRAGDMSSAPELVPASTFFGIRSIDGAIVGMIDVRHELNDYLLQFGGNIGYGVAPGERRKGYAIQMLRQALCYCRETLGLERALVTCNDTNAGSFHTIEKAGGVLENKVTEDSGRLTRRYWINL